MTLEELVALGQAAFPGHYIYVNLCQSTYGYPSARAAALTMDTSKHVALISVDPGQGSTAAQALDALGEAMRAGRWVREDASSIAAEGGWL